MNSRYRLAVICCAVTVLTIAMHYVIGNAQSSAPPIRLKPFEFIPALEQVQIPPGLIIAGYAQDQRGYYIVQFEGPVRQAWKDELSALGAELLHYIPDFAFKVRMNPSQARRAEDLDGVTWVDLFHPAYKLHPDLIRDGIQMYTIRIEQGSPIGLTTAAIAATGAQILSGGAEKLTVAAIPEQINAIAHILDVAWVENFTMFRQHNDFAGGKIMGADIANLSYDGSSQIIAVADTGLGGGAADSAHADIDESRIVGIFNWPGSPGGCFQTIEDDGAIDVSTGHGTHTTVSALGASPFQGRGVAPAAGLVFQALESYVTILPFCQLLYGYSNGYYLTGVPSDLNQLFQQAYNAGARIHSNSWGAAIAGDYDLNSANTDAFVWHNPDMTVTFSAGNEAQDANADGIIDSDSIASPATAKNVITVGASENDREDDYPCDAGLAYTDCSNYGGSNEPIIVDYGTGWGFPADPIKSDSAVGNKEQMAAFSSRGPTDDGRIKPDVVAPGTYVLSGYSDMYQQQYDPVPNPENGQYQYDGWAFPESQYHKYLGGTSMSSPLVAGGAALVRDYYHAAHGVSASAALVKATIINSAVDMSDENNDGADDNDYPIPNSHEGWGRVDLAAATSGSLRFRDNAGGLSTGESMVYEVTANGGGPLKVTLVWSDYPSSASASVNLVNDLDLIVTKESSLYYGNVFSGGWSIGGGSPDRRNNVENVYIGNPGSGSIYAIEVKGYNLPYGPQPFALVVDGADFSSSIPNQPPVAVASANPTSGQAPLGVQFTGSGSSDPDGSIASYDWSFGDGGSSTEANPNHTFTGAGTYDVTLTVTDNDGATDTASLQVAVTSSGGDTIYVEDISILVIAGKKDHAEAHVTILNLVDGSPIPNATVTGDWSGIVSGTSTAVTGAGGIAVLESPATPRSGNYVFTVTDVTAAGFVYDPSKNKETSDSSDAGDPPPPPPDPDPDPTGDGIHVGNLMGYSGAGAGFWVADVSITIHDQDEALIAGATVYGAWSGGFKGTASCTTNGLGWCAVITGSIPMNRKNVTFTVTDVTHAAYPYKPELNHDGDGDSDGTSIVIKKP